MKAKISLHVQKTLLKIARKDKNLLAKIKKQIELFETNPHHPSLRIHKLSGSLENMWSMSVGLSVRMVYIVLEDDIAYFVDIGSHDEVYRK